MKKRGTKFYKEKEEPKNDLKLWIEPTQKYDIYYLI